MSAARDLIGPTDRVLVTGASGFVGAKVVERLIALGFCNVACLVRPSSRLERLHGVLAAATSAARPQLVFGDLLSEESCERAATGATVVFHCAASFDKSFAGAFMGSALSTRNLIEAFLAKGQPRRFVNVSSFAVYSNLSLPRRSLLDEDAPIEDAPQERYDAYGFGKLKQEEIVRIYRRERGLPYVILRPGTVYGPGKKDLTGRIGTDAFGFFVHVGGQNELPLTFVDNCADAIVLAGLVRDVDGEVINVVDDERLTSAQFLRAYKKKVGLFSLRVPYPLAWMFSRWWEYYSKRTAGQLPPVFNRRRCAADWKGNVYTNQRLRTRLGWTPRVGVRDAMAAFLDQFPERKA